MRIQLEVGTLAYCGLHTVATHLFYEVDTNPEARREHLIRARTIGLGFLPQPAEKASPQ